MYRRGVGPFKYFVGISSLEEVATRQDRVCVLNILGGESSEVTPVSHAYSGGNVVFGTSPGRQGQVLKTPVELSSAQLAAFKKRYAMNARPVQPLHGRKVVLSP